MGLAHIHIRLYTRSCYTAWVSFFPIYNDPLMFCVRASLLGGHIAWRFWVTDDGSMKDICWGYVRSRSFLKGRARKSVIIYIAFTSNFFSQTFFPLACNLFFLTWPAGGASLFAGLHDSCGLIESRTIASPPLERCGVSYWIFSRRNC